MSDSRQSIIYKRMCKLQKCRIYPKSQVKNLAEWCCKLKNQAIFPKSNLHSLYIGSRRYIVPHFLESSRPYCSWIQSPRPWYLATPKVLAIDGGWGKRYNAGSDGAWKSTVPIILTVGSLTRAFSSGSVNGSVRSQLLTHIQIKRIPANLFVCAGILTFIYSEICTNELKNHFSFYWHNSLVKHNMIDIKGYKSNCKI